jgi:hypothetical protein
MSFQGLSPILFESVSAVTATPSVELGTERVTNGERYKYVYAAKTVSMGIGAVMTGTSGHTIVATGAVSGELCAGYVKHESIVSGSYGWLLKCGVVDASNGRASTAPSVDQVIRLAADGKFCSDVMVATSAIDGGHVFGKVLSAGASGGTGSSMSLIYVSVY